MATYLDSILKISNQVAGEQSLLQKAAVKAALTLFDEFDERIKEGQVIYREALDQFEESLRIPSRQVQEGNFEALGQLQELVERFMVDSTHHFSVEKRHNRRIVQGIPYNFVKCNDDECIILDSNEKTDALYYFDFWLKNTTDCDWLLESYFAGIVALEEQLDAPFDTLLLVRKELGPVGPAALQSTLKSCFTNKKVTYCDLSRTSVSDKVMSEEFGNTCLLYDLINTGNGVSTIAKFVEERYNANLNGTVVLFNYDRTESVMPNIKVHSILKSNPNAVEQAELVSRQEDIEVAKKGSCENEVLMVDQQWVEKNLESLQEKYGECFIAVIEKKVLVHAIDGLELWEKLKETETSRSPLIVSLKSNPLTDTDVFLEF